TMLPAITPVTRTTSATALIAALDRIMCELPYPDGRGVHSPWPAQGCRYQPSSLILRPVIHPPNRLAAWIVEVKAYRRSCDGPSLGGDPPLCAAGSGGPTYAPGTARRPLPQSTPPPPPPPLPPTSPPP